MKSIRGVVCCEICGELDQAVLDFHHIIPRANPISTDLPDNLALICANDHRRVHAGEIIIEGVFATTGGTRLVSHNAAEPFKIRPGIFLKADGVVDIIG